MTERGKPAQMLAQARQRIVAELDKAQQATANLGDEVSARNREIAKWLMRSDALLFALDALGPALVPRGRKPAANGTVEKPKRAAPVKRGAADIIGAAEAGVPHRARKGVVQETAAGERWVVDAGINCPAVQGGDDSVE